MKQMMSNNSPDEKDEPTDQSEYYENDFDDEEEYDEDPEDDAWDEAVNRSMRINHFTD